MARVGLIDPEQRPDLGPLVERFRGARRGSLLNIYRMLLHNPDLAGTWFEHMNAVRWRTALDGRLREIVIIRVGHLNRAAYIIKQHVPRLAEAEGLSRAECDALAGPAPTGPFSARELAALRYAEAMTRDVAVADEVYAALPPHFDEAAIVDLTVLIGTYNMHARVMNALQVDLEKD